MKPLADYIRPKSFDDIIGQNHLVGQNGVITKMLKQDKLFSMILYGPPGCGKTTISKVILNHFPLNSYMFNASNDNKATLKEIIDATKIHQTVVIAIDEIHRMKKDIQDFLLPHLEDGSVVIIGLTTSNPYMSINPAIRSRCHIYQLYDIKNEDLFKLLKRIISQDETLNQLDISDEIVNTLVYSSGLEIRTAINMLESVSLLDKDELNVDNVKKLLGAKALKLDGNDQYYYDILSAFIKSIRGSDVDASLLYLAKLITIGDLEIITRRLMVSIYEEVGLANPSIGPRIMAACEAAIKLGLPEAMYPLSFATIDLALSPKSNSATISIANAMQTINQKDNIKIPNHILNKELKSGKFVYKYPHDFPNGYVKQQYLPDDMLDLKLYNVNNNGKYEREVNLYIEKIKKESK